MKHFAALALTFAVSSSGGSSALGQARYIGWHSDLKTAAAKAAESGKPLMVVFRCVR